jgi:hypothetical protein
MDAIASLLPSASQVGYLPLPLAAPSLPGERSARSVPEIALGARTGDQTRSDLPGRSYGALLSRKDDVNALALALRGSLDGLVVKKMFPPYPPEQEAQMAFLDRISGVQQQVEKLFQTVASPNATESDAYTAEQFALQLSQQSAALMTRESAQQTISTSRTLLESVV